MAITKIASSTTVVASGATTAITVPAGVTSAHLVIVMIANGGTYSEGWTAVPSGTGAFFTNRADAPSVATNITWKVYTSLGGPAAGGTISVVTGGATPRAGNAYIAWYDSGGRDVTIAGTPGGRNGTSGSTLAIPGITTTSDDTDVIVLAGERTTATGTVISSWSPATPTQDLFAEENTNTQTTGYIGHFNQATAATIGTYTATYNSASTNAVGMMLGVDPASLYSTSGLVDAFDTADLSKWTYESTASVSGGKLVIANTSGVLAGINAYYTNFVNSSFSLSVDQIATSTSGTSTTVIKLATTLAPTGAEAIRMLVTGTSLRCDWTQGGATKGSSTATYNATNHKWWQIAHDGTNVVWSTSPDRVTWTTQYTAAVTIPLTRLIPAITAGLGTAGQVNAQFDNVNNKTTVTDDFTRTSTTTAGIATSGQAWRAEVGTWGTDGTTLGSVTAADNDQVTIPLDSLTQDVSVKIAAGAAVANAYPALLLNWTNAQNFLALEVSPTGSLVVRRVVASNYVNLSIVGGAGTVSNGAILRMTSTRDATNVYLTAFVNGTQIGSVVTDPLTNGAAAGTRVGFRHGAGASGVSMRWDDLYASSVIVSQGTGSASGDTSATGDGTVVANGVQGDGSASGDTDATGDGTVAPAGGGAASGDTSATGNGSLTLEASGSASGDSNATGSGGLAVLADSESASITSDATGAGTAFNPENIVTFATLTGTFLDDLGDSIVGSIILTPSVGYRLDRVGQRIVALRPRTIPLVNGSFSALIACNGIYFTWHCEIVRAGTPRRQAFDLVIPVGASSIDVADAATVAIP